MHVNHLEQFLELNKRQALVVLVAAVVAFYNSSPNLSKHFLSLFDFHKEAKAQRVYIIFPGPTSSKRWAAGLEPQPPIHILVK